MPEKPSRTPHLHVRVVDGFLFQEAVDLTGNRKALMQLRAQIDWALTNPDASFPYNETIYNDVYGEPSEVVVKLARRREEMEEPVPRPEKTPERLPWAELTRKSEERKDPAGSRLKTSRRSSAISPAYPSSEFAIASMISKSSPFASRYASPISS